MAKALLISKSGSLMTLLFLVARIGGAKCKLTGSNLKLTSESEAVWITEELSFSISFSLGFYLLVRIISNKTLLNFINLTKSSYRETT